MRILSFNVNSLRAIFKKENICDTLNFEDTIKKYNPDVVLFQETKFSNYEDNPINLPEYENYIFLSTAKKGYSGTMIMTKIKPLSVEYGIEGFNDEGRTIIVEYENCYVIDSYSPNVKEDLSRIPYRMDYDLALSNKIKQLPKNKPCILCGDLNVAPENIDIKNYKTNRGKAGFTDEERDSFKKILANASLVDSFRYLYPEKVMYSWWSYRFHAREKNTGWRIDHILVSDSIKDKIKEVTYLNEVFGSDHCPAMIDLDI